MPLLFLALALALLPLPSELLTTLFGVLLVSQVAVAAYVLLAGREGNVLLVGHLQDAVLLFAVLLAAACWREGNPWQGADELGLLGLALGLGGNAFYLKAMVHHQHAHEQMEREFAQHLVDQRAAARADLECGILTPESYQEKLEILEGHRVEVAAICRLGRQAGGQALLQLACLAVALAEAPGSGILVTWVVGVVLPGLVNSKAQDFLLYPYVPRESRLC